MMLGDKTKLALIKAAPSMTTLELIEAVETECKLAQPEQKPVAMTITGKLGNIYSFTGDYSLKKGDKIYTTPPKRTWVGLTDEDKQTAFDDTQEGGGFWEFADAIEAKLKEKNT